MKCYLCDAEMNTSIADELRSGEKRRVLYCPECDLAQLDDDTSQEDLKKFYQEDYRKVHKPDLDKENDVKDLFNNYVKFQGQRIKLMKPHLHKSDNLLEIGCSAGMFLHNIKKYVGTAAGIDYDISSAKFAQATTGCKVYTDELELTPLDKKSFDHICAFQMLEHVKSPIPLLKQFKDYLKDGGYIYIEVPNLYDALLYIYNLPNYKKFYYHSAHLFYFSRKSLEILFRKVGLTGNFHFTQDYNVINHFNWILNDKPQSGCMPGLSDPVFETNSRLDPDTRFIMNSFIKSTDTKYKKLLASVEATSNIFFIGRFSQTK